MMTHEEFDALVRNVEVYARNHRKEQSLVDRLVHEVPVPGQWFVVALNAHTAKIRKKMRKVAGAQLVRR